MRKILRSYYAFTDTFYGLKKFVKLYFYHKSPEYFLNNSKKGFPPVIIIHGYLSSWIFCIPLGEKLAKLGYPVYVIPQLGHNLISVERGAKIVRDLIDKEELSKVIIVGHSKGGIIGKYLLVHDNFDGRIAGLVALSSPFLGGRFASLIPSAQELEKGSDLLMDLLVENSVNKRIVTISPKFDELVPGKGNELPGAENIKVKITGHRRLFSNEETENDVVLAIEKLSKRSRI